MGPLDSIMFVGGQLVEDARIARGIEDQISLYKRMFPDLLATPHSGVVDAVTGHRLAFWRNSDETYEALAAILDTEHRAFGEQHNNFYHYKTTDMQHFQLQPATFPSRKMPRNTFLLLRENYPHIESPFPAEVLEGHHVPFSVVRDFVQNSYLQR